jgi:hypothetical protein
MRAARPIAALGLVLAAFAPAARAQTAPAWGLGPLMRSLAQVHGAAATFTETKTLTAAGRTRQFDLSQAPPLAGLVEGVRAVLAGDLPTLDRYYVIQLSGGAERWQLLLRPRDAGLSRFLSWLSVGGSGNRVAEIDTGGAHGDLTRMSIDETIDNAP